MSSIALMTRKNAAELLESIQYILLDVDGVLWAGDYILPDIPQTLNYLRSCGKQIRFISNNASLARIQLAEKFQERGIKNVTENEIYNSGFAAASRLRYQLTSGQRDGIEMPLVKRNIFVIGEDGLHEELRRVLAPGYITYGLELHNLEKCGGYNANRVASAWKERILPAPFQQFSSGTLVTNHSDNISLADLSPGAVVVGLDLHFNMLKLAYASLCLQKCPTTQQENTSGKEDVFFIATNEDPQIPIGTDGLLLPGCGGIVSALSVVSGRRPDVVCGKPHVDMAKILFEAEGITDPQKCLMVGDRLTTDIAFGNAAGCKTMFVLSGAETMEDVMQAKSRNDFSLLPDFIASSLSVFLPSS